MDSLQQVRSEQSTPAQTFEALLSITGMTCSSCVASITEALNNKPWIHTANVNLLTSTATAIIDGKYPADQLVQIIEDLGFEAAIDRVNERQTRELAAAEEQTWQASFSVEGMTCSSCVGHITQALEALPWMKKVNVNLISNNTTVEFVEKKHVIDIQATINNVGYTASLMDLAELGNAEAKSGTRSIQLHVDGFFCEHCPMRVVSILEGLDTSIEISKAPSLRDPILNLTYTPRTPELTIRTIFETISSVDPKFRTTVYHPPSVEERARAVRDRERWQVLYRLILSFVAAVPSFIIGIVFMSLVPSTNKSRQYLMEPWANVFRAEWALFVISTPVYLLSADLFHRRALREIYLLWRPKSSTPLLRRFYRFGSMNLLISLGTSIAFVSSVVELGLASQSTSGMHNETRMFYFDSVVFLTLFLLTGRLLEAWSKAKTGDAVATLGKLRPSEALLVDFRGGEKRSLLVQVDALEVGDLVQIANGSSPPCDGVILQGEGRFDESSLTGESRPVQKSIGDDVFSGTVNKGNPVLIRTIKLAGSSMLDQIIEVVRESRGSRAPIERVADKITSYFVPLVTLAAITTWIIWLALGESGSIPADWLDTQSGWPYWSLQFAIAVFIIACPCGIGLAAPTALFVGCGLAAHNGILVKGGGQAFQESSQLDIIVFDKTGTLTQGGEPSITDHQYLRTSEAIDDSLLRGMIATLEESSRHPLARAVSAFLEKESSSSRPTSIEEIPGRGMKGSFESQENPKRLFTVLAGNERLLLEHDVEIEDPVAQQLDAWKKEAKSVILVAVRAEHAGSASIGKWVTRLVMAALDPLRPESPEIVQALQQRGIAVWMISGDNATTANAIGKAVGIPSENVIAGVLPEQKAKQIQYLQRSQTKASKSTFSTQKRDTNTRAIVAMVGDGVNDSPALTMADVGIAIGSGSDVAISSAEFVLISSHLSAIPLLLDLSRKVFTRIKFNFAWALVYNLIALPVAAGVLYPVRSHGSHVRLDPVWASLAMALSSISVVMSSLALKTRLPYLGFKE
ncbi:MAG: hypothetical protein Q9160_007457 [Pyrenula sp. 1 TL-2023]